MIQFGHLCNQYSKATMTEAATVYNPIKVVSSHSDTLNIHLHLMSRDVMIYLNLFDIMIQKCCNAGVGL